MPAVRLRLRRVVGRTVDMADRPAGRGAAALPPVVPVPPVTRLIGTALFDPIPARASIGHLKDLCCKYGQKRYYDSAMPNARSKLACGCPVAAFQKIISGKYKLRIVWDLKDGPLRYSEIRSGLLRGAEGSGEIAPRVLSRELKALAENGLIDRKDFGVVPPKVEYRLTDQGKSFVPVIAAIRDWGSAHLGGHVRQAEAA